jgi:hypothetical protein
MRPLRAQLIAVLTVLAVLLPGSVFARTEYFCRMMNRVVATCCCDADSGHDPSYAAQVRSTDCCERITTGTRSATLKATGNEFSIPSLAIPATVLAPAYVFPRVVHALVSPRQARAPPGVGPPLFIMHCSLLT